MATLINIFIFIKLSINFNAINKLGKHISRSKKQITISAVLPYWKEKPLVRYINTNTVGNTNEARAAYRLIFLLSPFVFKMTLAIIILNNKEMVNRIGKRI